MAQFIGRAFGLGRLAAGLGFAQARATGASSWESGAVVQGQGFGRFVTSVVQSHAPARLSITAEGLASYAWSFGGNQRQGIKILCIVGGQLSEDKKR